MATMVIVLEMEPGATTLCKNVNGEIRGFGDIMAVFAALHLQWVLVAILEAKSWDMTIMMV
jgi:hypothetical protein